MFHSLCIHSSRERRAPTSEQGARWGEGAAKMATVGGEASEEMAAADAERAQLLQAGLALLGAARGRSGNSGAKASKKKKKKSASKLAFQSCLVLSMSHFCHFRCLSSLFPLCSMLLSPAYASPLAVLRVAGWLPLLLSRKGGSQQTWHCFCPPRISFVSCFLPSFPVSLVLTQLLRMWLNYPLLLLRNYSMNRMWIAKRHVR